jgi:hypothetical protein
VAFEGLDLPAADVSRPPSQTSDLFGRVETAHEFAVIFGKDGELAAERLS